MTSDSQPDVVEASPPARAVSICKSLADPAAIISMIDGKPYTLLTRHIRRYGYTPTRYREVFGLPHDYPMVTPTLRERRREVAQAIGLGRKHGPGTPPAVEVATSSKAEATTRTRQRLRPKY